MSARPNKAVNLDAYTGRFAARLRELRLKAKLTPEQAAELIGITATAIYHWESGLKIPAVSKFPKISEVYRLKKTRELLPNE